MQVLANTSYCS